MIVFVYFIIVVFLFLGAFSKQGRALYNSCFILLWILMAFRDIDLGGYDALVYQEYFSDVPTIFEVLEWESRFGLLYTLFNSIVKTVCAEYLFFQIVYSTIVVGILYILLEKIFDDYRRKCLFLLSFFCLRYFWDMWVILRQNIADLLFWIMSFYLYDKWTKDGSLSNMTSKIIFACIFVMTIIIPGGFHTAAYLNLILLPLLLCLSNISIRKKTRYIVLISLVLYFIVSLGFEDILSIISVVDTRYMMYMNDSDKSNFMYYCLRMMIFIFFSLFYERITYRKKDYLFDMMGVMVLVGSINAPIVVRFVEFYAVGMYGLLACYADVFCGKHRMIAVALFTVLLTVALWRFLVIFDSGVFMDYQLEMWK